MVDVSGFEQTAVELTEQIREIGDRIERLQEERKRLRAALTSLMESTGSVRIDAGPVRARLARRRGYDLDRIRTLAEFLPPAEFGRLLRPMKVTPERVNAAAVTRLRRDTLNEEVASIIDAATQYSTPVLQVSRLRKATERQQAAEEPQ